MYRKTEAQAKALKRLLAASALFSATVTVTYFIYRYIHGAGGAKTMHRELVRRLNRYVAGVWSFEDLRLWVQSNLDYILDRADARTVEMARALDGWILEVHTGPMSEGELRSKLRSTYNIQGDGYHGFVSSERNNL